MGQPELFAKRTFAEETELVTHGALLWQDAPEIGLTKVQGDGLLLVHRPDALAALPLPWSCARAHDELLVELKMPGDHLDVCALQRALLRRQARQVQRVEHTAPPWLGEEPLWLVAPHVPEVLTQIREVQEVGPGCYQIGPSAFSLLWIAANELPLREELIPFLVARSGRAQAEFIEWAASRRPLNWLVDVIEYLPMSGAERVKLVERFAGTTDPGIIERRRHVLELLLKQEPEMQRALEERGLEKGLEKGREEGVLLEARRALRRVLARRGLKLGLVHEARIDACTDATTLERWLDQAVTAATIAEALR